MKDSPKILLNDLMTKAQHIRDSYADLFSPDVPTIPIPFFGSIETAVVATIGLNPSDTEFHKDRWLEIKDPDQVLKKITEYFSDHAVPAHRWFTTWNDALRNIDVSYGGRSAVHIDVCPWATRPMSSFPNYCRFTDLVTESAKSFERSLRLATQLKLILISGTVNKTMYLNEYLQNLQLDSVKLSGKCIRPRGIGGFVSDHIMMIADVQVPVFFCSVSPSSRTKALLPQRILESSAKLKRFVSQGTPK